jgi:hypothetical protein
MVGVARGTAFRQPDPARRVIAHMNPLAADDVSNIETAFRKWVKQLKAVEDQLP